jgi:cobalamin transport system ATP-binding protein
VSAVAFEQVTVEAGGRRIVDGVSFAVEPGAWVSLLGPNGAGKTTLLRVLAGLRRFGGSVRLADRELAELGRREAARHIALVPQTPIVPPAMSVGDYVLLGRTPHMGVLAREGAGDRAAASVALMRLELSPLADRPLESLSGGELQRAVIARALAQSAPVLLLDEPTTALDVGHQQQVLELVDELRIERRLTVLSAMHDLTLAGQFADRLLLLDGGNVVADGPPEGVLTRDLIARHYGADVRVVQDDGGLMVAPARTSRSRKIDR